MKRQLGETGQNSAGFPVALLGLSRDTTSFNGYERELAGNEESVDRQKKRDESQTGGCTNGWAPSGSRLRGDTNASEFLSHPSRRVRSGGQRC